MKKRTGLYFGSFNPVHIGHLIISEFILDKQLVDEVWMVVSPLNPFKKKADLLDHHDRLELIKKATYGNKLLTGSNIEFDLPIPSYTVDTLKAISKKYRKREFSVIMGADNLEHLDKWKEYKDIINNYKVFVYPRLNHDKTDAFEQKQNIIKVKAPIIELSSTEIRKRIKEGRSIKYLTTASVIREIKKNNLYK